MKDLLSKSFSIKALDKICFVGYKTINSLERPKMTIGSKIKQARNNLENISQWKLAMLISSITDESISSQTVGNWEKDKCMPSAANFVALCLATGKDPAFFLGKKFSGIQNCETVKNRKAA